jgi:glycosyltransferase involved in cell wall biosynthesis
LRIGIDARPLTSPSTGIGRYTAEIVQRLLASGNEIYLYAHQGLNAPSDQIQTSNLRTGNLRHSLLGSLFAQLRYPRWARIDALDVFWSPRHHLPLASSVPSVVTIHDLVWRHAPESMIALGRTLERALMPPSLRRARAVIAVSEATRTDLVDFMPEIETKISVIPEAAFTPTAAPSEPTRSRTILFVGTFEPRKNIPGILRGFARLLAGGTQSHQLVLAGNPGWKQNVTALIEDLGLSDQVRIVRPQSQSELERLYTACDFLVMPSFYEGFGLPILEAMTFGKPVITSNLSSMPEVAGDAALLVDPKSDEQIATAMRRLIEDDDLYRTLSEHAQPQAARFSWDQAAADTLRVIESVAGSAG